jgi:WD40 repeat protein
MQFLSIKKKKRIHAIAFSPSGQELAAACGDGFLRIWNLSTGQVCQSIPIIETSCGYDICYLDNNRLLFAGIDLRWWDIAGNGWNLIAPGMKWNRQICLSPDRRYLGQVDQATSPGWGSGLLLYETAEWQALPPPAAHHDSTGSVAFSCDGSWLASGHIVRVGERQRSLGIFGRYDVPDYEYVLRLREWPSGQVVQAIEGWQQGIGHLAFSPSGNILAGTAGPRLRIWDLKGEREIALHKRGPKHFQGLSFMADGRYLATVSNDETVRIWETTTWQEYTTFSWEIGKLLNITFAPDGCRAAAGSDRGQIVIWDVEE